MYLSREPKSPEKDEKWDPRVTTTCLVFVGPLVYTALSASTFNNIYLERLKIAV